MNGAYTSLADWFEYLNADCDYEQWSQYLYGRLQGLGVTGGRGADIGCGSGAFTRAFARWGYDMVGFDVSSAMLARAEQLSRGVPHVRYGLADARSVRFPGGRADFALCVNDCVNYLPPADIPAFSAARRLSSVRAAPSCSTYPPPTSCARSSAATYSVKTAKRSPGCGSTACAKTA